MMNVLGEKFRVDIGVDGGWDETDDLKKYGKEGAE